MKQQQSQHNLGAPVQQQGANMNDFFKAQDPISILQNNFTDLNLTKDPQMVRSVALVSLPCCRYEIEVCNFAS